ncbi:lipopolysaccharide assembly protein LapB [Marinobacter sp. 1_MG-2023]|uniref:tetratricopeptide repeat protein n=1 Tax=Marinobacter sp. 1_MG-2023 TaxID=3062627 RepID=UPI0026E3612D|nr:hypothetical protein [Marinobacter sp. 1_MG-2023]MDO6824545.1 hypothetical protein [Marinobacter sp. 1_MG-2023]
MRTGLAVLFVLMAVPACSESSEHLKPRQQALFGQAEVARSRGDSEEAGKILADMAAGYWSAVGYLNLSSDYARNDLNPSRALVALRVALAMADKDADTQRKTDLQARILLRAGYLSYSNSEYEKAIGFLERIPLNSHKTPQALYFHGLALAEQGHHRAAMQSWHRAKKYPLAYPGVAEAWLGMGRGYDLAGYLGQAGEAYLSANAAYESERVTLRKLARQIEDQGAYKALVLDAQGSFFDESGFGSPKVEWFLADSRTLAQPRMAYLLGFMEQPASQEAVSRVANLEQMEVQLQANVQDLDVFIASITGQLESSDSPNETVKQEAFNRAHSRLQTRLNVLLERLGSRELSADQHQQLRIAKMTLSDSGRQVAKFQDRFANRSRDLKALLVEARQLRESSLSHLESVSALRGPAEVLLDELALGFVKKQDKKMMVALDKAEQQIAHLYEYLALKELESGEQGR